MLRIEFILAGNTKTPLLLDSLNVSVCKKATIEREWAGSCSRKNCNNYMAENLFCKKRVPPQHLCNGPVLYTVGL